MIYCIQQRDMEEKNMNLLKQRIEYDIDTTKIKKGDIIKVVDTRSEDRVYRGMVIDVSSYDISVRTPVRTLNISSSELVHGDFTITKLKVVEDNEK